jgi:hypothetical protein
MYLPNLIGFIFRKLSFLRNNAYSSSKHVNITIYFKLQIEIRMAGIFLKNAKTKPDLFLDTRVGLSKGFEFSNKEN